MRMQDIMKAAAILGSENIRMFESEGDREFYSGSMLQLPMYLLSDKNDVTGWFISETSTFVWVELDEFYEQFVA